MPDPVSASVGAGALSMGGGVLGGVLGGKAQENAAKAQANAAKDIYYQQRADFMPYMQAGYQGLGQAQNFDLEQGVGKAPSYDQEYWDRLSQYQQSPAFQAQNALAQKALGRQLQARGLNYGPVGAALGAEQEQKLIASDYDKYRGDLASRYQALQGEYGQRRQVNADKYNQLLNMVKVGQGAAGSVSAAGGQMGTQVGQALGNQGQAQAGLYSGLGQVIPSGVKTASGMNNLMGGGSWFGNGSQTAYAADPQGNMTMGPWAPQG